MNSTWRKRKRQGLIREEWGKDIQARLGRVEENIRNNNTFIERLSHQKEGSYVDLDYMKFENRFRGTREQVKESQRQYLSYFLGRKNVIDLGCGRGEFLELLLENNVPVQGVDFNQEVVAWCHERKLPVVYKDALMYIRECPPMDGIFAAQLVEHLTMQEIVDLCKVCYEKLEKGAYMILETPNPMSLAIYTHSFYIDPTHSKPVHPLTLQYIVEEVGFESVSLHFTETSKFPMEIPELKGEIENAEEFNTAMKKVSDTLFGSQDYALIARK